MEKLIRQSGRAGTDALETNGKIRELVEKLPAPPDMMRKSLEENWGVIIRSMDRGIRERLCFQIPSDDRESFLVSFCSQYEKRYGLPFEIPEERRENKQENMEETPVDLLQPDDLFKDFCKEDSLTSCVGRNHDDTKPWYSGGMAPRKRGAQRRETTFGELIPGIRGLASDDSGDQDLLQALSADPRSLYHERSYRPAGGHSGGRSVQRRRPIIVTAPEEKIPLKAEDYKGKLVRYEGKTYRVVDIGYDGYLLIDKETSWSETTAVKKEDVELYRY